jgi:hypothetical protein
MVSVSLSSASDSDDVDEYGGNGSCGDDEPCEFRLPTAAAGTKLSVAMLSSAAAVGGGGEYGRPDIRSAHLDECPDNKCLSILLDESFLLEDDSKGADETARTLCHENSAINRKVTSGHRYGTSRRKNTQLWYSDDMTPEGCRFHYQF